MRIALFAAVVAAHIVLVWYFLSLWHVAAASEDTDEPSMTLVFLPPMEPVTATESAPEPAPSATGRDSWQAPQLYHDAPGALEHAAPAASRPVTATGSVQPAEPREKSVSPSGAISEPPGSSATAKSASPETSGPGASANIDWRTQAEIIAQANAQHIVESEDRAARQAGALTAMIKPRQGPHNPAVPFPWDLNPRYRFRPAEGGGYVMALNDHCQVFVFIMVFVGCTVGESPPARGDLFKNMHPPVKFGDWDWRLDDP